MPVRRAATLNSFNSIMTFCMRAERASGSESRHGPTRRSNAGFPDDGVSRFWPLKALRPVSISNSMAPKLNMSLRASAAPPRTTSGAVYGVIAAGDSWDGVSSSTPPATSARFAGVTAPCAFPASRSLVNDSASCMAYWSASATGSRSSPRRWARVFVSFNGIFGVNMFGTFEYGNPAVRGASSP